MFGSVLFLGPNEKRLLAPHDARERRPCYKSDLGGAPTAKSVSMSALPRARACNGSGKNANQEEADDTFSRAAKKRSRVRNRTKSGLPYPRARSRPRPLTRTRLPRQ